MRQPFRSTLDAGLTTLLSSTNDYDDLITVDSIKITHEPPDRAKIHQRLGEEDYRLRQYGRAKLLFVVQKLQLSSVS